MVMVLLGIGVVLIVLLSRKIRRDAERWENQEHKAAMEAQWRRADTMTIADYNALDLAMPPNTRGMTPLQIAEAQRDYYQKRSNEPANPIAMRDYAVKAEAFQQMADEL